jgi:hypothetical protein
VNNRKGINKELEADCSLYRQRRSVGSDFRHQKCSLNGLAGIDKLFNEMLLYHFIVSWRINFYFSKTDRFGNESFALPYYIFGMNF